MSLHCYWPPQTHCAPSTRRVRSPSDKPLPGTAGADRVEIDAPASAADNLTESQREAQDVIDKARRIQPERQQSGQDKALARQDLDAAQSQLETAKQVREGDRQGTAGGGSRLTPAYTERVEAAEKQAREAAQRLEQAR